MDVIEKVQTEIERLLNKVKREQYRDGSWRYCFESGPMTDAYTIMILRVLEYGEEDLIVKLVNRLLNKQHSNGSWKLYDDETGNLSATVEAYTALLFSGYLQSSDTAMKKAEEFILQHGGLEKTHAATKYMLALHGLYPWPAYFPFPLFLMNLPKFFPISFYKFSSYVKTHFASILLLGHKRFVIQNQWTPNLQHLFTNHKKYKNIKRRHFFQTLTRSLFKFASKKGMKKAEQYMLQSVEEDGTLSSYASATFFFIYALLSLGYHPASPLIQHAMQGILSFLYKLDNEDHVQNSPSTIWDTALMSYVLQESGISPDDESIQSAAEYLVSLQQTDDKKCSFPGGWSFSESNTHNPDIDDTQAVLRAITNVSLHDYKYRQAWNSGVNWLLAMQNHDGGWGSFGKSNHKYLNLFFPIQGFEATAIDSSTADVTGRTLEFLGTYLKMNRNHPRIEEAVNWLIKNQKEDGSWYGRWGISYIYGTWAAITGMKAVGVPSNHPSIQKAVYWLRSTKQSDGGWGESCKSDIEGTYIPLSYSTIVHTSWALDALISVFDHATDDMEEGMLQLVNWSNTFDKRITYPTGGGLPRHFYIYYHSYPYIWTLLAFSHYQKKYK